MRLRLAVAAAAASALISGGVADAAITHTWSSAAAGSVDGTASGDVDGDGFPEIAAIVRGAEWWQVGRIVVYNADGSERWSRDTGAALAGYPTFGDYDGDGADEVAFCEITATSMCYIFDGDGTELSSFGPFYFAGLSYGGPSAADFNGDGADDLVVTTWGGVITAIDGRTGVPMWAYDAWANDEELFHGHAAIGDIDGDGDFEIVVGGSWWGSILVFDALTGAVELIVPRLWDSMQNYFSGNGPLLVDLDGDKSTLEIVASLPGTVGAIVAFTSTGALMWRTPAADSEFTWHSPVAADVDLDGDMEIIAQSFGGILRVLDHTGTVVATANLGSDAWVAPAFVDMTLDVTPELVVATKSSLVILDGTTLVELDRYDDPAGGLMPAPLVVDLDRDLTIDFMIASWWAGDLRRLSMDVPGLFQWSSSGGNAKHDGRLDTNLSLGGEDATDLFAVQQQVLQNLINDPTVPAQVRKDLKNKVLKKVNDAFKEVLKGDPKDAIKKLKDAIKKLGDIKNYDTTALASSLAFTALRFFEEFIDRAEALMGPSNPEVVAARGKLAAAYTEFFAGSYEQAVKSLEKPTDTLKKSLAYVGDFCGTSQQRPPYLTWECDIQSAHGNVSSLLAADPGNQDLAKAQDELQKAMTELAQLDAKKALDKLEKAADALIDSGADVTAIEAEIASVGQALARTYLDDVALSGLNNNDLPAAEAEYAAGVAALMAADYHEAIKKFKKAADKAKP